VKLVSTRSPQITQGEGLFAPNGSAATARKRDPLAGSVASCQPQ